MYKIKADEKEWLLKYVLKEPELNLFVIGDIENFGMESTEVEVFAKEGTEDEGFEWDSIILRYFDNYIVYSQKGSYDSESVGEFLRERTIDCISGKTSVIRQLEGYFPDRRLKPTTMLRCDRTEWKKGYQPAVEIRKIKPEDADKVVGLYLQIEEFSETYQGKEEKQKEALRVNLKKGGMGMGLFEDGKLLAVAETSAANSMGAMIVGVATLPEYRRKGYATKVLEALCEASFQDGKQFLCLFYDNPQAGAIYKKAGFSEVGEYALFL